MLVFTGLNFERADTLLQFELYGPIIQLFPETDLAPFSVIFVHIGWEHFIVNMISSTFLDDRVEEIFGSVSSLFFLYLLSGMMGNLFVWFHTESCRSLVHPLPYTGYLLRYRLAIYTPRKPPIYPAVGAILDTFRDQYHWKCSDSRNQPSWAYWWRSRRLLSTQLFFQLNGRKDLAVSISPKSNILHLIALTHFPLL